MGSTGDPPVPSGDSPDGTATDLDGTERFRYGNAGPIPLGESPSGAGGSPALPRLTDNLFALARPLAESGRLPDSTGWGPGPRGLRFYPGPTKTICAGGRFCS